MHLQHWENIWAKPAVAKVRLGQGSQLTSTNNNIFLQNLSPRSSACHGMKLYIFNLWLRHWTFGSQLWLIRPWTLKAEETWQSGIWIFVIKESNAFECSIQFSAFAHASPRVYVSLIWSGRQELWLAAPMWRITWAAQSQSLLGRKMHSAWCSEERNATCAQTNTNMIEPHKIQTNTVKNKCSTCSSKQ